MDDSCLISTPMSLNTNMPTLETKETKTQRELRIIINGMKNALEHFGKKIEQQNEDSSNRISQLEACLTATLDEFKHYIHQAIPAYTKKEETGMLKTEIETLKEENSKLRNDMCEKDILIKHLTETLNEVQTKVTNRNQTNGKRSVSSKYNAGHEKRICSTSKHSG